MAAKIKVRKIRGEGLDTLRASYDALMKASDESLRKAFDFGQVIDALSRTYTTKSLADAISVHPSTIEGYARLFRKFGRVELLIDEAHALGTYNVRLLSGGVSMYRYEMVYHCLSCGSDDIAKERHKLS